MEKEYKSAIILIGIGVIIFLFFSYIMAIVIGKTQLKIRKSKDLLPEEAEESFKGIDSSNDVGSPDNF